MSTFSQTSPRFLSTLTRGALLTAPLLLGLAPSEASADYFESDSMSRLVSNGAAQFDVILVHGWHVSGLYSDMSTYSAGFVTDTQTESVNGQSIDVNSFRFGNVANSWGFNLRSQYGPWIDALGGSVPVSDLDTLNVDETPDMPYWTQTLANGHKIVATTWSSREGTDNNAITTLVEQLEYAITNDGLCQDRGCVIISHSTGGYLVKHALGESQLLNDNVNVHLAVDSAERGAEAAAEAWNETDSAVDGCYITALLTHLTCDACLEGVQFGNELFGGSNYTGLTCGRSDYGMGMAYEMRPSKVDAFDEEAIQTATLQIPAYEDSSIDFESSCGTDWSYDYDDELDGCDRYVWVDDGTPYYSAMGSFESPGHFGDPAAGFSEFAFPFLGTLLKHQYAFEADDGSARLGTNFAIWHERTDGRRYTNITMDGYARSNESLMDTIIEAVRIPVRYPVTFYENTDQNDNSLSSTDCAQSLNITVGNSWRSFSPSETDLCFSQLGSAYPPMSSLRVADGYRVKLRKQNGDTSAWITGDLDDLSSVSLNGGGNADFSWDNIDEIKVRTI